MSSLFIVSAIQLYNGHSAGSARMMNVARAVATEDVKVYLCSMHYDPDIVREPIREVEKNIFVVDLLSKSPRVTKNSFRKIFNLLFVSAFLLRLKNFSASVPGQKSAYIYPSMESSLDVAVVPLLKWIGGWKIFYEMNELRRITLYNASLPQNVWKRSLKVILLIVLYVKYYCVELATVFYDGIVAISTSLEQYFLRYNKNIIRIPILAHEMPVEEPSKHFSTGDEFTICFTGMISLKKEGFDILYAALSNVVQTYDRISLHLYGSVSKDEKEFVLNSLPKRYNIQDKIHYYGNIPQTEVAGKLRQYHLLILPRPLTMQAHYGFSTKLSEYLVSNTPVLVTDVSDNGIYIKDGNNGFIIRPNEPITMANKIIEIINNYNKYRLFIGKQAQQTVREHLYYKNYSQVLRKYFTGKELTI